MNECKTTLSVYNAPVKLSCTHPPWHPRGHHFFGCPGLLITFFLPCPALINHFNPFIFQCPALFFTPFSSAPPFFMTHIFLLTGGVGSEQFDRRIVQLCKSSFLFLNFFTCGDKEIFLGGTNLLEEAEIQYT